MSAKRYFKRTLSSSNLSAAKEIHDYVKFQLNYFQNSNMKYLKCDMINSTILIQSSFSKEILMFLCDKKRINNLLMNGVLNWCELVRPLCPISTENDGNSLLHSISLYTLGVHDRYNLLRQILNRRMKIEPLGGEMRNRWCHHSPQNNSTQSWDHLVELSSDRKYFYPDEIKLGELNSFHIFVMANIFGRPIVVLSEQPLDDSPEYGGIYLPLLRNYNDCIRSPIVLVYDNYSFSPALSCESINSGFFLSPISYADSASHCVPLVHRNLMPFKIHFLLPSEIREKDNILSAFLDISCFDREKIKVAFLTFKAPLAISTELMNSFVKEAVNFVHDDLSPKKIEDLYVNTSYRKMGGFDKNSIYAEGQSNQLCSFMPHQFLQESVLTPMSEIKSRFYENPIFETNIKIRQVTLQDDEEVKPCLASHCAAIGISKYNGYCHQCYNMNYQPKMNLNKNESDKYDFDRTKVFCNFAGCESNVSTKHSTLCDLHMGSLPQCCLNGCENTAEDNDIGLCLTCYRKSKDDLKFITQSSSTNLGSNKTDKGFDDFLSIVHNLPPLPSTDMNPLMQSEGQAPRHRIYGSQDPQNTGQIINKQSFKQSTNLGSNKTDEAFDDFLSIHNLTPLPSTDMNPLMQSEGQAPRHRIYGSQDPQNTGQIINKQSFELPPIYKTLNQQGFENSQSNLIWQKSFVDSNNKTCKKCKAKTADLNGLCSNCYQSCTCKQCGESSNIELIQGFLCNKCYTKQQKNTVETKSKNNLHNIAYHRQDYNLLENKKLYKDTSPCSTPGCILFAVLPSYKCHVCQKKESVSVEKLIEIKNCVKSGCEFYGSPEYNGLCSGCFMELTIKESTQRQTNQHKEENAPIQRNNSLPPYPDMVLREQLNNSILSSSYAFTGDMPCLTIGCTNFGSHLQNGFCDRCFSNPTRGDRINKINTYSSPGSHHFSF